MRKKTSTSVYKKQKQNAKQIMKKKKKRRNVLIVKVIFRLQEGKLPPQFTRNKNYVYIEENSKKAPRNGNRFLKTSFYSIPFYMNCCHYFNRIHFSWNSIISSNQSFARPYGPIKSNSPPNTIRGKILLLIYLVCCQFIS
jgi:hypothetical protein